jgi:hypothetical protein
MPENDPSKYLHPGLTRQRLKDLLRWAQTARDISHPDAFMKQRFYSDPALTVAEVETLVSLYTDWLDYKV